MESSSSSGSSPSSTTADGRSGQKRLLIVGRRGRGKTSLCNLLLYGASRWPRPVAHSMGSQQTDLQPRTSADGRFIIQDTTGFDGSVAQSAIMDEIYTVITSATGVDGILFVMNTGRCDPWDVVVFELYLQVILSKAPSTMVGVVFTRCTGNLVEHNDLSEYLLEQVGDVEFVNFRKAVLERCRGKVCFVDNPDPKKDSNLSDMVPMRAKSLANLHQLIDGLSGRLSFDGLWDTLLHTANEWLARLKESPAKYLGQAVVLLTALAPVVMVALGRAK